MKKSLLGLLTAVLTLVVLEGLAWAFFGLAGERFSFAEPEAYVLRDEELPALARRFDPDLGWSPRFSTPLGERPHPIGKGPPLLAAFGDSYTFGDEVGDHETWEQALAERRGQEVYNFGVGGYGPDQALLRFRGLRARLAVPVVVLGFGLENVNRVVNRYRPFYAPFTGLRLPKPRFILREGSLVLLPLPLARPQDLARLTDPGFIAELGAVDYWYSRGRLPHRSFPRLRLLFDRAVWTQALESRRRTDTSARPLSNLWKDREARALFLAILDAFVREAQGAGLRALLVLQPSEVDVQAARGGRGIPGYQAVLDHCRARGHSLCDGIAALAADREVEDLRTLSRPGGHLTAFGNARLARVVDTCLSTAGR